jgi:hypothetical protein
MNGAARHCKLGYQHRVQDEHRAYDGGRVRLKRRLTCKAAAIRFRKGVRNRRRELDLRASRALGAAHVTDLFGNSKFGLKPRQ